MKKLQRGFTLIELMIVVAIIGVLAAIAIPAYQDYIARSQMSEALTMVDGARLAISDYAQTNGAYPTAATSPSSTSLATTGKFGSATVESGTGTVTVTMFEKGIVSALVAETTVTFQPPQDLRATGSIFTFACSSTAQNKFLPKHCVGS